MAGKNYTLKDFTESEGKELLAGCAARRKSLDTAFKACIKQDVLAGADKVSERIKSVMAIETKVREVMEE